MVVSVAATDQLQPPQKLEPQIPLNLIMAGKLLMEISTNGLDLNPLFLALALTKIMFEILSGGSMFSLGFHAWLTEQITVQFC